MSARNILMAAAGSADDKLYVDDVFSAYTYTGNNSIQTISNGIDLAGKGGLVWRKGRSNTHGHLLEDTARGAGNILTSSTTSAQYYGASALTSFSNSGFSLGSQNEGNASGIDYISWAFRKAAKFFDVVTYTKPALTNDTAFTTTISNPGMVIIKRTSTGSYAEAVVWGVWHRSLGDSQYLGLNTTDAVYGNTRVIVSGTAITHRELISESAQFVAYVFAHDPSADGIIQCGSFTTDASGNATVNLGWEPQYLLLKNAQTSGYDWEVYDSTRGMTINTSASAARLRPNLSDSEGSPVSGPNPNAVGFTVPGGYGASQNVIYLAIRRPNKPPTTGTQVYNAIARTGTGADATVSGGQIADAVLIKNRGAAVANLFASRLTGSGYLVTSTAAAEVAAGTHILQANAWDVMDGIKVGTTSSITNSSGNTFVNHFFKRAPGFFDVVCYTGTGSSRTVNHSLGVAPELVILKARGTELSSNPGMWFVSSPYLGADTMGLNYPDAKANYGGFASALTATSFSLEGAGTFAANNSSVNYIAYLFASLPGISKVGSYTGNGTTQTINCGFTTGARFVLIKRTNLNGDWYVWDTARGIVTANDPHFSLNTPEAAEVTTDDSVDPDASGFIVNHNTTYVNVSGGQYIFLAIA